MLDDLYQRQRRQITATSVLQWPGLQGWSFYFLGKAALALTGRLELLGWWNLAFIAILVVPLRHSWLKVLRQFIAVPVAVAMLYVESYLPPFSRLLAQWEQVSQFSGRYILELFTRFVSFEMLAIIMVAWIVYLYVRNILRMTVVTFVVLAIALWQQHPATPVMPLRSNEQPRNINDDSNVITPMGAAQPASGNLDPEATLDDFYRQQSRVLERPVNGLQAELDIVLINLCSLSWQDLETYNLSNHPFLRRQDIVFDQYSSGSSYSGPAALRLLRANCGHTPHEALFEPPNNQCFLTESLGALGYESQLLLNHTGEFDNFKTLLAEHGGFAGLPVTAVDDVPEIMMGFDDTPVYSDLAILENAVDGASQRKPNFTFYNSVSLHDGNRLLTGPNANNSARNYPQRLQRMLDDLSEFYDHVKASGRPTLVIVAPEHGSGLQGDTMQLPGVREIPTPALTKVPVLMRVFGADIERSNNAPVLVSEELGPSAISSTIYQILAQQPTSSKRFDAAAAVRNLPVQRYVAENDSITVMERELELWLKIENEDWIVYPLAN